MANTGNKVYRKLEEYVVSTGAATGNEKLNWDGDSDYIAPVTDTTSCPVVILTSHNVFYTTDSRTVCDDIQQIPITLYQDSSLFNFNNSIYTDSSGTTLAPANWYTNGAQYREWDGTAWRNTTVTCPI